ncbi:hypothetical protein BC939DRAFT_331550 [Gamsiella multidivaricata]|uniref:uncharacterized protein n=1 Tax=Gamsiella multidivaricata TaxID=101098 RepID=UPI00221F922E|nr:uncharacterized protein BC939DRAFT_331550 [Gamsiella multidivaricata]KAI7817345.1 hypothetical protein BC939DRAFT_331550 [Gamsiella multidivaricata]
MARALDRDLAPSADKKRKLSALLAIEHALQTYGNPKSTMDDTKPSRNKIDASLEKPNAIGIADHAYPDGPTLLAWVSSLSRMVRDDGDSSRSMTRLISLALDVSIAVSRILADQTLQELQFMEAIRNAALVIEVGANEGESLADQTTYRWCFSQSMQRIQMMLTEYQSWNLKISAMESAGLADTLKFIQLFNNHRFTDGDLQSHKDLRSFAQSWGILSSVLFQRGTALALAAAMEQILELIPKASYCKQGCLASASCLDTVIHPYHRTKSIKN